MQTIELEQLTKGEVHNLSGHDRGQAARVHFKLSELDGGTDVVLIHVPEHVYTITSSFFQGMFAESVKHLGDRESFFARYRFDADPVVLQQVEQGIRASLMKRNSIFSH
ncbi:hypothetical protein [Rhizobium rhizogenes]|uniref:hypothetical protein n=1 Tax=Rhizobium rhizogenes TaxID=359 RepID=UPI0024BEBB6B|nr:hypothetical protein [Rhizobium rhizogenes]MDJ1632653.1 hypothetical protein [Rhizobium rhizogenes]